MSGLPPSEPRILGFLCHWCSYAGADHAGQSKHPLPPGFSPVRVMCTCRIRPEMVLGALQQGADGVLIMGCHPKDCHYRHGNLRAKGMVGLLRRTLDGLGWDADRVRIEWVSAQEGDRLAQLVNDFAQTLREKTRETSQQEQEPAHAQT